MATAIKLTADAVRPHLDDEYELGFVGQSEGMNDEDLHDLLSGDPETMLDVENRCRDYFEEGIDGTARAAVEDAVKKAIVDLEGRLPEGVEMYDDDPDDVIDDEARERLLELVYERDRFDAVGDMLRETHGRLMLADFGLDIEGLSPSADDATEEAHIAKQVDRILTALGQRAHPRSRRYAECAEQVKAILAECLFHDTHLYVIWYAPPGDLVKAVEGYAHRDERFKLRWVRPQVLLLNRGSGAGMDGDFDATVELAFEPGRLGLDEAMVGWSWTKTAAPSKSYYGGDHVPTIISLTKEG